MNARTPWITVLVPIVWGTTYAVTSELLPPGRPLLAASLRALPAGLALVALTRTRPRGHWWWRSALLGALNFTVFFAMLFTAAYRLPGGVAATAGAIQPLLVMFLATVALNEKLVGVKLMAGLLGILGVGLLVLDGSAKLDGVGVVAALVGAASMATGSTLVQRWGRPASGLAFAGWQLTAGGLLLVPLALAGEGLPPSLTAANLGGYLYLATIGGAVAYAIWFRGIALLGAQRATFLSLLSPVVATIIGFALGDDMSLRQLTGGAVVVASISIVQLVRGTAPTARPASIDDAARHVIADQAILAGTAAPAGDRLVGVRRT